MAFATRRSISMPRMFGLWVAAASVATGSARAVPPTYVIYDIGIVGPTDSGSQGNRVSAGGVATGRSLGTTASRAFTWTVGGGLVGLPNLVTPARNFSVGNGVNDVGAVVGTGSTTAFGSNPLPLIWQNGVVSQLPLPAGQTLGRANDVNSSGLAVGSVNAGSAEAAAMYSGGTGTIITQTAADGSFMRTAFSINDAGLVVGQGIDPNNAARNVGLVYNSVTNTMFEVGALPGLNGALAFDVSNGGHVVGSSMLNQGSGLPFIWTSGGGIQLIPLPVGTTQGSARGVNANGWAVGTASSAFAIPFLYDGVATYRVHDLLPPASGWDLATNTSSSALSINENGVIVGTGVHNSVVRAYAMVPDVPVPVYLLELAASDRGDGIELRWRFTNPREVAEVRVERATAEAGPWSPIAVEMERSGQTTTALDRNAEVGPTYFYRLRVRDQSGTITRIGMVSTERGASSLPVRLASPAPNPATEQTVISFRIRTAEDVDLAIIDVQGRVVRTLVSERISAGPHQRTWDGRTDRGGRAPAGIYFIRLRTAGSLETQRVTLLR